MFSGARLIEHGDGEDLAEQVIVLAQSEVAYLLNLTPDDVRRNRSHHRVTPLRSQGSMMLFRSGDCVRGSVTHVPIRLQGPADRHRRTQARTRACTHINTEIQRLSDALTRADWFAFASLDPILYPPDRHLA